MKKLLILISALITTSVFAQVNPTNLSFYPMEVVDTLKSFNPKKYSYSIKKINDDTFILQGYKNSNSAFFIKRIKNQYIVFDTMGQAHWSLGDLKVIKNFIIIENTNGGSSTSAGWAVTTWKNSFFTIINTLNLKVIDFQSEYQTESLIFPEQKPKETDDDYDERRHKESKHVSESCTSNIKFNGLYLRVSRTYRNGCKVCVETGTYKLVKDKFIKLRQ